MYKDLFGIPKTDIGKALPLITNWQQFNMVIGASTTAPAKATVTTNDLAFWRRVGDSMEIRYQYSHASNTGASSGTGTYYFNLPLGYTIDASKFMTPASGAGQGVFSSSVVSFDGTTQLWGYMTAEVLYAVSARIGSDTVAMTSLGSAQGALGSASLKMGFACTVPIAQWSIR